MKRILLAAAATIGLAAAAHAGPIATGSQLSLNGSDTYTATSISFTNPANIGGESGSFTVLSNCTGCVTMSNFTTATSTPFTLYSATEGAISTSLSVLTDNFNFTPGTVPQLTVSGHGILSLTGFTPTAGDYVITTQGPTGPAIVTFSVTSVATPEPASLGLLGVGLLGLGLVSARKRQA